jgi:hypothetical protein
MIIRRHGHAIPAVQRNRQQKCIRCCANAGAHTQLTPVCGPQRVCCCHALAALQMFAANIGWAAPAGLGYALGTKKRMLVIGGDGGLQMTSGSIGDYVKCGTNAIWVCVNNDGCECGSAHHHRHPRNHIFACACATSLTALVVAPPAP